MNVILPIIGIIEILVIGFFLIRMIRTKSGGGGSGDDILAPLHDSLEKFETIYREIEESFSQMVDLGAAKEKFKELDVVNDLLKAERGRITITNAELETVESRLRDLEEIERELQASGLETQEEMKILQKKEQELKTRNTSLKNQIGLTEEQLTTVMSELEISGQVQAQIDEMKSQLLATQEKTDQLILLIEQGNEEYFILKQRYDALDIEYAQLYERFSEIEAATGGGHN